MTSKRRWWAIFAACTGLVLVALVWVTVMVVRLEQAEVDARARADHQEALRLALWRMDSWLAPLLGREAARPYFDYQPFYPEQRPYTTLLSPIEPGEVLAPSPLLAFQSEYFTLHYQIAPDGTITSPQAPVGSFRDRAEGTYLTGEQLEFNREALDEVSNVLNPAQVAQCVSVAEAQDQSNAGRWKAEPQVEVAQADPSKGWSRGQKEFIARRDAYQQSQKLNIEQLGKEAAKIDVGAPDSAIDVGSLVPFWASGDGTPRLMFTRRIRVNGASYYQGFASDWPKLRQALLGQIADLFPTASLLPVLDQPAATDPAGSMLATIPVALEVPAPVTKAAATLSPVKGTLALAWLAVLAGIAAVAVTLRASIAFGQKRSRFASAVTHELRTPLTTFQMYSEMLADGMVRDEGQRREYLETLKQESARLANLVENVMAYARLEEGRRRPVPRVTTVGALLAHVVPPLRRGAEAAGMTLIIEQDVPEETALRADPDAVGQVLGNLVDNACKYAGGAEDRNIHLSVRRQEGRVALSVRDHGPGIPRKFAGTIFSAFDRGGRDATDAVPGLGLGLALGRGLARDLGGELTLEEAPRGASFRLTLPV